MGRECVLSALYSSINIVPRIITDNCAVPLIKRAQCTPVISPSRGTVGVRENARGRAAEFAPFSNRDWLLVVVISMRAHALPGLSSTAGCQRPIRGHCS